MKYKYTQRNAFSMFILAIILNEREPPTQKNEITQFCKNYFILCIREMGNKEENSRKMPIHEKYFYKAKLNGQFIKYSGLSV